MALVVKDRVKETTTTTGTGSVTLSGAATGFQTFNSAIGVSNTTYYCIAGQGTSEWEVGLGTLSAGTTLARTTVLASSNGGTAVTFSAGTKDVFCTYPAGKSVSSDSSSAVQAWVNFNGTGTVAIRASLNVSSITDNGVGDYTVNFATAMIDADYCFLVNGGALNSGTPSLINGAGYDSLSVPTTAGIRIGTGVGTAATLADYERVCVSIFR